MRALAFFFLLVFSCQDRAAAQDSIQLIRAGIHVSPPFTIVDDNGGYYGMAIELWQMVEKEMGFRAVYISYLTVDDLLTALQQGAIDIALSNLTVTRDRAQKMKFTYPWYDAGQRIMVKNTKKNSLWEDLKRAGQFPVYLALFGLFTLIAVAVTLVRRRIDPEFTKVWIEGLFFSLYEVIITSRSGRLQRNFGWKGHALSSIWMIFGMAAVAYLTSAVTSSMTTASLTQVAINSPADLRGRYTGVLTGSASEEYLRGMGNFLFSFTDIDEAGTALSENQVQAVVADAPVVEYWAYTHPDAGVTPTGELFRHEKYAFALNQKNDDLAEAVSLVLINLHEDGRINELKVKFTGYLNSTH
jgi:ABC-type amino acid transport substrate-binding protein